MEHDFRHTSREEETNRGMIPRTVWQDIDEPRNTAVNLVPLSNGRSSDLGSESDRRDMQQQIRRTPARGMNHHGIVNGRIRDDFAH